jgi:hydroxyacylglutathione hydrolase
MKTWVTTGGCQIDRLLFGRSNVFLVTDGKSRVLVDTGWRGDRRRLMKLLGQTGGIDAVIMTHTHFDHAGNAGLLKERFSPLFIVQEKEKDFLESGDSPIPGGNTGWTRLVSRLGAARAQRWFHVPRVKADIVFGERYDLAGSGIDAYIMHTPGHSAGSSSIVIGHEIALVGDTMAGFSPSIFPPWGDDAGELVRSWEKLLATGCLTFLPAHGFSISRKKLEKNFLARKT